MTIYLFLDDCCEPEQVEEFVKYADERFVATNDVAVALDAVHRGKQVLFTELVEGPEQMPGDSDQLILAEQWCVVAMDGQELDSDYFAEVMNCEGAASMFADETVEIFAKRVMGT